MAALVWARRWYESHPEQVTPRLAYVWAVVAVCLVAAVELGWPDGPVPAYLVALYAVLSLPLTRLLVLPAAVTWNRHR